MNKKEKQLGEDPCVEFISEKSLKITIKEKDDKGEDMYEMVNGPNHTFEVDMEGTKKHQKRIDDGIMLFSKYYGALWD